MAGNCIFTYPIHILSKVYIIVPYGEILRSYKNFGLTEEIDSFWGIRIFGALEYIDQITGITK